MAYPQYTECVQPKDHKTTPVGATVAVGLFTSLMSALSIFVATGGIGAIAGGAAVLLGIAAALLHFTNWWLYGRLVCLDDDKCAIGLIVSVEPPEEKSGFERFDSDYSFNLLLPPHNIGDTQKKIEADGFLGKLIKEQAATKNISLPFDGYTSSAPNCGDPQTAVLHCEIEGAGMDILRKWLIAIVAMLSIATAASWFCFVPVIGWITCAITAVLTVAAVIAAIAGIAHAQSDAASPSDIDPSLGGSLHWGCNGQGADLVVVTGKWVYDSFHGGWNEIHPVRHLQRIGTWKGGPWPFVAQDAVKKWCSAVGSSTSPLTVAGQAKPENKWRIHPEVDGCDPDDADFAIRIKPEVGVATPGKEANYEVELINLSPAKPSNASVTMTVDAGLPAKTTATFTPKSSKQPPAKFKLKISTPKDISLGTMFEFTVRGTDQKTGKSATAKAKLLAIKGIK